MKVISFINAHKILVPPIVLEMMWYFANWSTEAFVYLSLHGTYSVLWLIKEVLYPDRPSRKSSQCGLACSLSSCHWQPTTSPRLSRHLALEPFVIGLAIGLYTLGIFLHYVSDAQKYYTLQLQKGLIEDGLFGRTRNPNYLGEILIYISFAILSWHWLPFVVLSAWVVGFFFPNMRAKDQSLSRHPGFAAYKLRTGSCFQRFGGDCISPASHSALGTKNTPRPQ